MLSFVLQEDVLLYFSRPPPPEVDRTRVDPRTPRPRVKIPSDTSEPEWESLESSDDDGETLASRLSAKSRPSGVEGSSRPAKRPLSEVESSMPAPPQKKRNTLRKRVAKVDHLSPQVHDHS